MPTPTYVQPGMLITIDMVDEDYKGVFLQKSEMGAWSGGCEIMLTDGSYVWIDSTGHVLP